MVQRTVNIATVDGSSSASLHIPEPSSATGPGPWPAVILYPDAGGLRDATRAMGERLAGLGYVVLVPDFYYRQGPFAPFDMGNLMKDPAELGRLMGLVHGVHADMVVRDARAYIDYLTSLPQTAGTAIGTTGYCMGGRISLTVAGHLGDEVAAAASFHGGSLADADSPESPHLWASDIAAQVYVAGATDDATFPTEQRDRLEAALTAAGVTHTIETYPAAHGFAVTDMATYDAAAAQRHWDALTGFYAEALTLTR